jgi:hypothetical protein
LICGSAYAGAFCAATKGCASTTTAKTSIVAVLRPLIAIPADFRLLITGLASIEHPTPEIALITNLADSIRV